MIGTHTLVRIEAYTDAELTALVLSRDCGRVWTPPTPIKVPRPPDYSTPAKVSARCRERGTKSDADIRSAMSDKSVRNAYAALRALVPAMPVRVEDLHRSRWRIATAKDGARTLRPLSDGSGLRLDRSMRRPIMTYSRFAPVFPDPVKGKAIAAALRAQQRRDERKAAKAAGKAA